MGVMSCSRKRCENIMCDTYINDIGYVCNECQGEFKDYLESMGMTNPTEGEIRRYLKKFMESDKNDYIKGNGMGVENFFDQHRSKDYF